MYERYVVHVEEIGVTQFGFGVCVVNVGDEGETVARRTIGGQEDSEGVLDETQDLREDSQKGAMEG